MNSMSDLWGADELLDCQRWKPPPDLHGCSRGLMDNIIAQKQLQIPGQTVFKLYHPWPSSLPGLGLPIMCTHQGQRITSQSGGPRHGSHTKLLRGPMNSMSQHSAKPWPGLHVYTPGLMDNCIPWWPQAWKPYQTFQGPMNLCAGSQESFSQTLIDAQRVNG